MQAAINGHKTDCLGPQCPTIGGIDQTTGVIRMFLRPSIYVPCIAKSAYQEYKSKVGSVGD